MVIPDLDLALFEVQMSHLASAEVKDKRWLQQIFQCYSLFFEKLTTSNSIAFTTLFSRIAYAGVHYNLAGSLIFESHYFRKMMEKGAVDDEEVEDFGNFGLYLIHTIALSTTNYPWKQDYFRPSLSLGNREKHKTEYKRVVEGLLVSISDDVQHFSMITKEDPDDVITVSLETTELQKELKQVKKYMTLPLVVNMVDVTFYDDQPATARAMVLRPDMLFGVTSISECFSTAGATALAYLGRKLIPSDSSVHMLIGNIVNQFLDDLIHNPSLQFSDVMQQTFRMAPEAFSLMTDAEVKDCISKVKVHFENLKKVVSSELSEAGITKERSYLEPSFYSNEFGLQGRLDLYHYNERQSKSDIVELKSGRLYQAHKYGLNQNHYLQTLLYDLILESVYNGKVKSTNYILYSGHDGKRLRFAPKVRDKQLEAMRIRNRIVLLEEILTKVDDDNYAYILSRLDPKNIPEGYTFLKRDAKRFWDGYGRLTEMEQSYFRNFISFISREFQLSKIGRHGIYTSNGLASLWLDPMMEKADMFTILSHLEVSSNDTDATVPTLTLTFTDASHRLSKFRVGDITVLYPFESEEVSVLSHQLFKCTILAISSEGVTVRLRARQKNFDIFRKYRLWNLEADVLDSGFRKQFHGLYEYMISKESYRLKILCAAPPEKPNAYTEYNPEGLTKEQLTLLNRALSCEDYFLLWGPPGTGKTSIMIAQMIYHLFHHTEETILLLAYTNRAVDEICAAAESVIGKEYIRVGSRYSTADNYKDNLLSSKTENLSNRKEFLEVFESYRVFISTVSSFQGKRELFALKNFDTVIVDEASQLLEPMLVGMLGKFTRFILIGDHKQLPAVVTQGSDQSKVKDTQLASIGLVDSRMSLFERMYKQCDANGWDWAIGGLQNQGRMHRDIVSVVSDEFYNGKLSILEGVSRLSQPPIIQGKNSIQDTLIQQRLIFVDTPRGQDITRKTNINEALIAEKIASHWRQIYEDNQLDFNQNALGVITPFRSQIAMIKSQAFFSSNDHITIDTIERYQGGARDRIIVSLAVSQANLLDAISNVSDEGIDRKLNVALTRARENLVILGNKAVLQKNALYARLIGRCYEMSIDLL